MLVGPRIIPPLFAMLAAFAGLAFAQPALAAQPVVRPAIDGVLAAFDAHPLVGLGDVHGLANEGEFYNHLVRDPRFAAQVGNVVVEFAGAAHQDTLDRYVAGEEVPYAELRRVWSDTVGAVPTVTAVMYQTFFAQVRATNRQLPPERRIHVWAGEEAIDWSAIHSQADYLPYNERRDEHAAQVIEKDILARGKKALVIYGSYHFNQPGLPPGTPYRPALKEMVEAHHPGAFYVVTVYGGYVQPACSAAFEAEIKWPPGTLAAPVRGGPLEAALLRPGCSMGTGPRPVDPTGAPAVPPEELAKAQRRTKEVSAGLAGDALLYLGPASRLMDSPDDPTLILDEAYFREIARRFQIMVGAHVTLADWVALASHPPGRHLVR